ncbi:hypothetical protein [Methylobacterium sp. WL19]|uniref:hypothetical protein n=1 Tax=Methylobacterium sp. WL19 TaxID=2603896 RepID=UPI0011CA796C|nr:hypothetical protein [Methylobacterium sp. WL19]TXN22074.1 hypothetical protein FV220_22375 [Methylobacterium sp. WL19]
MSETYEKARAIAEATANRWEKFDDTAGVQWLADAILDFGALPRDDGRCMCPACKDARERARTQLPAALRAQRDQARAVISHIYHQYIINRGDMTDAEALRAIKVLAGDALGEEPKNVG